MMRTITAGLGVILVAACSQVGGTNTASVPDPQYGEAVAPADCVVNDLQAGCEARGRELPSVSPQLGSASGG